MANPDFHKIELFVWLKKKNTRLASRLEEIRREISNWLPKISELFPHYPQHGLEHSDRICSQLSSLLFSNHRLSTDFSPEEVYCLLAAAYLHDSGMVASNSNITEILGSKEWEKYIASNPEIKSSTAKYIGLQNATTSTTNKYTEIFIASVAFRHVLAEFIRKQHHLRATLVLELYPYLQQLVDFGEPVAFDTIASIAVGHGLVESELSNTQKYPEERNVLGGKVNVRFLTRLLRIGDLLDVDTQRSNLLSRITAEPLPESAIPHWKQYHTKTHENISPSVIEYTFECNDQETHRTLRNWFGWLETEVKSTGTEQLHSTRHADWKAPRCSVGSLATSTSSANFCTIIIKPHKDAKYTFHDWKITLDHEKILERLIHDVYESPMVFARELLQNALDATRCKMYEDFKTSKTQKEPEFPTQFSENFRSKYPIRIRLESIATAHPSDSNKNETQWAFTIEDHGTGMNQDIIGRYFLQVGRSYYQSSEFKERFRFNPTSRFGIGFLSVFAVSKNVTVSTAIYSNTNLDGIKLSLYSPQDYFLTEKWVPFPERHIQRRHGTSVRVILNPDILPDQILEYISDICVRTEIPIIIHKNGKKHHIKSPKLVDKDILKKSNIDENGCFIQRVFEVDSNGIQGQIALCCYRDKHGEGWADCWSPRKGLDNTRIDTPPKLPRNYIALHGLAESSGGQLVRSSYRNNLWSAQIDVRSPRVNIPMSRHGLSGFSITKPRRGYTGSKDESPNSLAIQEINRITQEVVSDHLATSSRAKGNDGIYYIGNVFKSAPVAENWLGQYPGTILTWVAGNRSDISLDEFLSLESLTFVYVPDKNSWRPAPPKPDHISLIKSSPPLLSPKDLPVFSHEKVKSFIASKKLTSIRNEQGMWIVEYGASEHPALKQPYENKQWWTIPLTQHPEIFHISIGDTEGINTKWVILNEAHPLVRWLLRIHDDLKNSKPKLSPLVVAEAWRLTTESYYLLDNFLERWRSDKSIPAELKPPTSTTRGFPFDASLGLISKRSFGLSRAD